MEGLALGNPHMNCAVKMSILTVGAVLKKKNRVSPDARQFFCPSYELLYCDGWTKNNPIVTKYANQVLLLASYTMGPSFSLCQICLNIIIASWSFVVSRVEDRVDSILGVKQRCVSVDVAEVLYAATADGVMRLPCRQDGRAVFALEICQARHLQKDI